MKKRLILMLCMAIVAAFVWAAGNVVPPSSGGADLGTTALPWGTLHVVNVSGSFSNATAMLYGSNLVIVAGGTITVPAGSIANAALVGGLTQVITNSLVTTNIVTVVNGIITANSHTP